MPNQDPPSARMRAADSPPRRRHADPKLRRREIDRQPAKGWLGAFLTVTTGILFLGYVFNVGGFATKANHLFSSMNSSAQAKQDLAVHVVALLYPALGLFTAALVCFWVLRAILNAFKGLEKGQQLADRKVITLETFKKVTEARGVRPRIATQAYELLLPFYSDSMRARLEDRLVEDLHMKPAQIQDIYAKLLRNTDRKETVSSVSSPVTVFDLLKEVQDAQRQSLMNSVVLPAARSSDVDRSEDSNRIRA